MNFSNQHLFLIADIDRVLALTQNPEEFSHQTPNVLHKVRSFLAEYQAPSPPISNEIAQQIAQVVVTEIEVKKSQWLQPLQLEINELNQRRQEILKDIRQLEIQRQEMMSEFLEILMERFNQVLENKINRTLKDATYQLLSQNENLANTGDLPSFADISTTYLDQLQHFQQESDQIIQSLDLTFRTVFDSLKQDLNSYEIALTQGLQRIYDLGEQSETIAQDYLGNINPNLSEPFLLESTENLSNFETVSQGKNQDLEVKKNLKIAPDDQWLEPILDTSILREEPEIRPFLEIDLNHPKSLVETANFQSNLSQENQLLPSEELEKQSVINSDLTFAKEVNKPDSTVESILFGEKAFENEQPLSYKSLEEILAQEFSSKEKLEQNTSENSHQNEAIKSVNSLSESEDIRIIDSIKLLTDLLEEGALDNIENEINLDEDQENIIVENENLLPNTQQESLQNPEIENQLTPDKLQKLAQDLATFGGEVPPQESNLKMLDFPSPWDDLEQS